MTEEIHDIKGNFLVESVSVLKESPKKIIIRGIVMQKDNISRNKVLYDWETVVAHAKELIGRPLLYNHLNDGDKPPVGKVTNSWIEGNKWLYEADVNPKSEYADSILRGDLANVSIQLIAAKARPEKQGEIEYTRAFVGDLLELSVVPTPGFIDANIEIALAEAFKTHKEDQTTSNNPSQTMMPKKKIHFKEESDDMKNYHYGLIVEAREHKDLSPAQVMTIVEDHLEEDPTYYDNQKQAEFYIVTLGVQKIQELLERYQ